MADGSSSSESSSDSSSDSDSSGGKEDADEPLFSVTKWCIALRSSSSQEFSDWVPVALLALACGDGYDPKSIVPSAIGSTCREVVEGACQDWPSLKKVGRETLEYGFEPLDSFESHVYEGMTTRTEKRAAAVQTLGLEAGWSPGDLKKARKSSPAALGRLPSPFPTRPMPDVPCPMYHARCPMPDARCPGLAAPCCISWALGRVLPGSALLIPRAHLLFFCPWPPPPPRAPPQTAS